MHIPPFPPNRYLFRPNSPVSSQPTSSHPPPHIFMLEPLRPAEAPLSNMRCPCLDGLKPYSHCEAAEVGGRRVSTAPPITPNSLSPLLPQVASLPCPVGSPGPSHSASHLLANTPDLIRRPTDGDMGRLQLPRPFPGPEKPETQI